MRLLLPLLFLATPLAAQDIPAVGTDATLDVATWNIEHFGNASSGPSNDELQFDNVLAVMQAAEIDLWALQEMDIEADFDDLVETLGAPYDGVWVADETSFQIGYGFIYNTDVVQRLSAQTILDDFSFEFAFRPPLLLRANITLPDTTVQNVRFIDVHAKCCSDASSYNRRVAASEALKNYLDVFLDIDTKIIVLGDLNDELRTSITGSDPSPYQNFRDDEDYRFATEVLDLANVYTFCSNLSCTAGSTLDHILLPRTVETDYQDGSMARFDEVLTEIPSYVNTTSDHVPVYARFDFAPPPVAAEDETTPTVFALRAPFPNPFREATTLTYDLPAPADVRLDVFDALGRLVATLDDGPRPAGTHDVTFAPERLVPGLYLVRLTAGEKTATRRLVRVQ